MIRIANLKAPLDVGENLASFLAGALKIPQSAVADVRLHKKSVDARDKDDVHFVLSLDVSFAPGFRFDEHRLPRGASAAKPEQSAYRTPAASSLTGRPVVVGLGPAGLFAALVLARAGARPIVLERGKPVLERARDVNAFWGGGALDPSSNVQFGEGGAGAFSDGKLTTGISDPRCGFVLTTLHQHGAPEEILYLAKPHIGTDKLPRVVQSIREEIVSLGGEVLFETRLTDLLLEDGRVAAMRVEHDGEIRELPAEDVILAVGHSARDTFESLYASGVPMRGKPFSIGARIEHPQKWIDRAQYGQASGHPALGAADYKLNVRLPGGRGVYTFCMCPGGTVVAAASEPGGVVTNGMSRFARDGGSANSALLVDVRPEDCGGGPLDGVAFQRKWERAAFEVGGGDYRAPAQLAGDFLKGVPSKGAQSVEPSYRPGVRFGDLSACLPGFALSGMREAMAQMDKKLNGFAQLDAVLTGVETRSSSPLSILRGEGLMSEVAGLYPSGEGAGYAGGIMSAAVDGVRCAEALLARGKR
jgi:uncharacterized FAD-dependent dehydrogenase